MTIQERKNSLISTINWNKKQLSRPLDKKVINWLNEVIDKVNKADSQELRHLEFTICQWLDY